MADGTDKEMVVMVLQGGGALGSYQAGAFVSLAEAGYQPEWIAGISIGAINGALIAGNPPEKREWALRTFWERVSSGLTGHPPLNDPQARALFNEASASYVLGFGVPGFFRPKWPPPLPIMRTDSPAYYDSAPLIETLDELIDFDLIHDGPVRLSVGAVSVKTGNFDYFDNRKQRLGPEHIAASGALPPGLPAILVDGEPFWDGGLVSNTPLQYVLDNGCAHADSLVFQMDLFSAAGPVPQTLADALHREKEIRFSSRTRLNTDVFLREQTMRRALTRLIARLPADLAQDPDVELLAAESRDGAVTIVQLVYERNAYMTQSKDHEFSRVSMLEHWAAGALDVADTIETDAWKRRTRPDFGVAVFDVTSQAARRGHPTLGQPRHLRARPNPKGDQP
jgi:NTE family protein